MHSFAFGFCRKMSHSYYIIVLIQYFCSVILTQGAVKFYKG